MEKSLLQKQSSQTTKKICERYLLSINKTNSNVDKLDYKEVGTLRTRNYVPREQSLRSDCSNGVNNVNNVKELKPTIYLLFIKSQSERDGENKLYENEWVITIRNARTQSNIFMTVSNTTMHKKLSSISNVLEELSAKKEYNLGGYKNWIDFFSLINVYCTDGKKGIYDIYNILNQENKDIYSFSGSSYKKEYYWFSIIGDQVKYLPTNYKLVDILSYWVKYSLDTINNNTEKIDHKDQGYSLTTSPKGYNSDKFPKYKLSIGY